MLLALWIAVTAPGALAAILSVVRGVAFLRRTLRPQHPELIPTHRVEIIRDVLLAVAIGGLLGTGLISAVAIQFRDSAVLRLMGITLLFLTAVTLSLMAIANYWLRYGK